MRADSTVATAGGVPTAPPWKPGRGGKSQESSCQVTRHRHCQTAVDAHFGHARVRVSSGFGKAEAPERIFPLAAGLDLDFHVLAECLCERHCGPTRAGRPEEPPAALDGERQLARDRRATQHGDRGALAQVAVGRVVLRRAVS